MGKDDGHISGSFGVRFDAAREEDGFQFPEGTRGSGDARLDVGCVVDRRREFDSEIAKGAREVI